MNMKRKAGTAAAMLLLACQPAPAPAPSPDLDDAQMAALTAVDDQVNAAMASNDATAYTAMMTDDVTWMVPTQASIHGKAAIADFLAQFASIDEFTTSNRMIRGSGNLAYRTMDYTMRYTLQGSDDPLVYPGKLLTVYRRQPDGRWLVEAEIWNPSPAT